MIKKEVREKIESLNTIDVYSMLLWVIYELKDDPKYSTLSELVYILNKTSLLNLLEYYGGKTITIPTISELKLVLNALMVYEYVNIENKTMEEAEKLIDKEIYSFSEIKQVYYKVCKCVKDYDFRRN